MSSVPDGTEDGFSLGERPPGKPCPFEVNLLTFGMHPQPSASFKRVGRWLSGIQIQNRLQHPFDPFQFGGAVDAGGFEQLEIHGEFVDAV